MCSGIRNRDSIQILRQYSKKTSKFTERGRYDLQIQKVLDWYEIAKNLCETYNIEDISLFLDENDADL